MFNKTKVLLRLTKQAGYYNNKVFKNSKLYLIKKTTII